MGRYLNLPQNLHKAQQLIDNHGAEVAPVSMKDMPEGKLLVCVVQNGPFDAAAVVRDARDLHDFNQPDDLRPKTWLLMDGDKVKELL